MSRFHVLRSRARFWRCGGRRLSFSCFALPDAFSMGRGASSPVFMFCAPGHVFGCIEGVRSRFLVLCSRTHFRRYRGRRVLFSCLPLLDTFSAVQRAWGPVFMFCALGVVFGDTECVGSRFHVLRACTRFWRYRGRRVTFSCFALTHSFLAVPRALAPVFTFCDPELIFGGTEGVRSRFNVLRFRTRFRRYRGRPVQFTCLALPEKFSAVRRASSPVFMFCAPGLFFYGTKGDDTDGVGSRFHVLRSRTHFRRYLGRRVPF
jgi:hypothetical protein